MNVIRFSDLCASGQVAGQRVFIRADLNVPQAHDGSITEDTRIRASGRDDFVKQLRGNPARTTVGKQYPAR